MAELVKKLQLYSNTTNTTETAKIYTTTAELIQGKPNMPVIVDSIQGYVQLDELDEANPTRGRVYRNADSKTYQICSQAIIPYGEKAYTTPGTFTFTVPQGVKKIRVAVCGAAGSETCRTYSPDPGPANVPHGETSYLGNLIKATGGGNSYESRFDTGDNGSVWGVCAGDGGKPNGFNGVTASWQGERFGWALGFDFSHGNYGFPTSTAGPPGGGGYDAKYLDVAPGTIYEVKVGTSLSDNYQGGLGTSGFVLVAWGGDIR